MKRARRTSNKAGKRAIRRFFRHWRNKKVYDAWDYGHKGWPIG